jgi:hypothetical protein
MNALVVAGGILLVLGLLSLVVPIPQKERHGIEAGGVSVGITTHSDEKVSPILSGAMIVAGAVLLGASRMRKAS